MNAIATACALLGVAVLEVGCAHLTPDPIGDPSLRSEVKRADGFCEKVEGHVSDRTGGQILYYGGLVLGAVGGLGSLVGGLGFATTGTNTQMKSDTQLGFGTLGVSSAVVVALAAALYAAGNSLITSSRRAQVQTAEVRGVLTGLQPLLADGSYVPTKEDKQAPLNAIAACEKTNLDEEQAASDAIKTLIQGLGKQLEDAHQSSAQQRKIADAARAEALEATAARQEGEKKVEAAQALVDAERQRADDAVAKKAKVKALLDETLNKTKTKLTPEQVNELK